MYTSNKQSEFYRDKFYASRNAYNDIVNKIENEIISFMRNRGITIVDLHHKLPVINANEEIRWIDRVNAESPFDLTFSWETDSVFKDSNERGGESINWLELYAEVMESVEYGILD